MAGEVIRIQGLLLGYGEKSSMAESLKTVDAQKLMDEHFEALRGYAKRVVANGGVLSGAEERDKTARMNEFMANGRDLGLSDSDLYTLVFGDMVQRTEPKCGCPTCRKRAARDGHTPSGGEMTSSAT